MSALRLTFLYPIFYRPLRTFPAASHRKPTSHTSQSVRRPAKFSTTTGREQGTRPQRYGTAQEPLPHLTGGKSAESPDVSNTKPPPKRPDAEPTNEKQSSAPPPTRPNKALNQASKASSPSDTTPKTKALDAAESLPSSPIPNAPRVVESNPLETVLHMPSPAEEEKKKPPHLQTPLYVHHFDTYGLVKDLEKSGFSQDQAVSLMKAVRGLLTDNMNLARDGLVSKSNVENETYLFRAACSELRTEISNNRKSEIEKMRTERNQLQHEVDILNQRLAQDSLTLKDELKGMFDDRKMAVRMEQRSMETKIQELNYKITVALNSDARSEVEGLRWVLTRRAAIAIGISAIMILATLRYYNYMTKTQAEERKKAKKSKMNESEGNSASNGQSDPGSGGVNDHPGPLVVSEEPLGDELLASEGGVQLG
ncbi:hypothetical protein K432DRAFT_63956 [Lepidopterella palustris CBS 459.81]|uniref:DUF1640-domain-containing protein n=1 Tax=Lepidopterella palustris CBS 459.81 TaxID=1314670 RepID=A0A8E2E9E2_9PEZI|nr:hypothetical protein K432DRAFT_63956 [Lepidopterella palustris CBS 459.81]